jgi:predicted phage tail component-like protein
MNSIIWRGVSSTLINGLIISELPPITKPEMRIKQTEIDGRDGSIIEGLGYATYTKTVKIGLHGNYDINKVIKYFTGEGDIVFSNEPDKVYKAKICGKIDYTRLLRYRQANISFLVQPFKYKLNEYLRETKTATASGTQIYLNDVYKLTSLKVVDANGTLKTIGKNLFDVKTRLKVNRDGLASVLNEDGGITTSGIPTADYVNIAYCDLNDVLISGHTYTLTQKHPSKKVYMQLNIKNRATGGYTYIMMDSQPSQSFIADTETNEYAVVVQSTSMAIYGTDNTSTTNYYQLEEGAIATDFEPHKTASYEYTVGAEGQTDIYENIQVFPPRTTIINTNIAEMTATYFKPFEVFNEGLESSKPLFILKGSGTVEISVNGVAIFTYTFPEGENEVYIDSEIEDAYLGSVLKNRNMNGEFPILIPKTNIIEWSGDIESISILPRSRWL